MTLLDAALDYCRRGWSVIPLRFSGTVEDRKRPLLEAWEPYQKMPATEEQVRAWWTKWPQANVGLVTGAVSGLIVLDLDGPNAVALLHRADVFLPKTAAVQTGKGHHAFYQHPGYPTPNRAKLLSDGLGSGVDIRGDGGYVVAPPSVHGSGHVYRWVVHPDEGIAPLPPDLAKLILDRTERVRPGLGDTSWVDEAMRGVPEGQRDDTCSRLAGYWLHRLGGDAEDTLRILRPWAARCESPFPEADLRKVVTSIARRDAAERAAEQQKGLPRIPVIEPPEWLAELERTEPRRGVSVSVPAFDVIGGLVPGDLIVIAGRPGTGKSTIACQLCVEACLKGNLPTFIVSTEMTRAQWGSWMNANLLEVTTRDLPRPLPAAVRSLWLSAPIAISDPGTITIQEIRALAESRLGLKLLIVDYLGRVNGGRKETRTLEVGDVARGLKSIAKDLGCTVVALCQLNRRVEGDDNKEPRLSDLRDSGEIEQDADSVAFLWSPERDQSVAQLNGFVSLRKNRHGEEARIATTFDKPRRRIIPRVATVP